jgi:hypothetical protein
MLEAQENDIMLSFGNKTGTKLSPWATFVYG